MERKETAPVLRPPNPNLPYREDCWSEGATSTLIDAWGDRFLELNRGNLRQKHWQEVADAVNSRRTAVRRPSRTHVQCKNRIDTLKKKYKAEKARIIGSSVTVACEWPFYDRLDALIGASSQKPSPPPRSPPLPLPLPGRKNSPLPAATVAARSPSIIRQKRQTHTLAVPMEESIFLQRKYSAAAAAAAAAAACKDEQAGPTSSPEAAPAAAACKDEQAGPASSPESSRSSTKRSARRGRRGSNNGGGDNSINSDSEAVRELAQAILRFGEIYERVEGEKQRQMVELERQRMEFTKGVEFQRMQIFMDSMLPLQKIKRVKRDTAGAFEC